MKKTIFISVSTLIIGIGIGIGAEHYFTHTPRVMPSGLLIYPQDDVDGRPTFSVVLDDEKVLDYMYAEEIAECLLSGKWRYNEDAHIPLVSINPLNQ